MTLSADVRLRPTPPTWVVRRNTEYRSSELNFSMIACLSPGLLIVPSMRKHLIPCDKWLILYPRRGPREVWEVLPGPVSNFRPPNPLALQKVFIVCCVFIEECLTSLFVMSFRVALKYGDVKRRTK